MERSGNLKQIRHSSILDDPINNWAVLRDGKIRQIRHSYDPILANNWTVLRDGKIRQLSTDDAAANP